MTSSVPWQTLQFGEVLQDEGRQAFVSSEKSVNHPHLQTNALGSLYEPQERETNLFV